MLSMGLFGYHLFVETKNLLLKVMYLDTAYFVETKNLLLKVM